MKKHTILKTLCAVVMLMAACMTVTDGRVYAGSAEAPGRVTEIVLTASSQPLAELTWHEASGDPAGYKVYRNNKAVAVVDAEEYSRALTEAAGEKVYVYKDEDLTAGASASYTVRAYASDEDGDSVYGTAAPVQKITDGYSYSKSSGGSMTLTGYSGNAEDLDIPGAIGGGTVTEIGEECFRGNPWIQNVTVPDGVVAIDDYAFEACSSLDTIDLPDSVRTIGDGAFSGCADLSIDALPDSLTSVGRGAFLYCGDLGSLTLPENVISIGRFAFAGCGSLESISLAGTGITEIPERAFYGCGSLASIAVPSGLTSVGAYAFSKSGISYEDAEWIADVDDVDENAFAALDQPEEAAGNSSEDGDSGNGDAAVPVAPSYTYDGEDPEDFYAGYAEQYPTFLNIHDDFIKWVMSYIEYNKGRLPDHMPFISMYCGNDHYRQMTSALDHDAYKTKESIRRSGKGYEEMYLMIDHGFEAELARGRMPENQDLILYSGISTGFAAKIAGYDEEKGPISREELDGCAGKEFTYESFMSTTASVEIAMDYSKYSNTVMIIYASKEALDELGSACVALYSKYTNEEEILLSPGATFSIKEVGTVSDGNRSRNYLVAELLGKKTGTAADGSETAASPSYVWADDYSSVTGTIVYSSEGDVVDSETETTEDISFEVITKPTTTETGIGKYTARFKSDAFSASVMAEIPVLSEEEAAARDAALDELADVIIAANADLAEGQYTSDSFDALKAAIDEANALYDDDSTTADDVAAAKVALIRARRLLEPVDQAEAAEKKAYDDAVIALSKTLIDAYEVDGSLYKADSYKAFLKAVSAADAALEDEGSTAEELAGANAAVLKAWKSLEKKSSQKLVVKTAKKTVKAGSLRKSKKVVSGAIKVKQKKGTVTYKKVSGSSRLKVSKKTGKITIKKATRPGSYKIKVKVTASGNSNYKAASKTVTVRIRVR